jgi:hypothetical protein
MLEHDLIRDQLGRDPQDAVAADGEQRALPDQLVDLRDRHAQALGDVRQVHPRSDVLSHPYTFAQPP